MSFKLNYKKKIKKSIFPAQLKNVEINFFSEDGSKTNVRIGSDFQADIPILRPEHKPCKKIDKSCLFWAPPKKISENKLKKFIVKSKEEANYTFDQALGMLFWREYKFKDAFIDIKKYKEPNYWTDDDSIRFETFYTIHGKNFTKIRQMMPDKEMSTLVHYYYLRKIKQKHVIKLKKKYVSSKANVRSDKNNRKS